jgi:hypothetical protein
VFIHGSLLFRWGKVDSEFESAALSEGAVSNSESTLQTLCDNYSTISRVTGLSVSHDLSANYGDKITVTRYHLSPFPFGLW